MEAPPPGEIVGDEVALVDPELEGVEPEDPELEDPELEDPELEDPDPDELDPEDPEVIVHVPDAADTEDTLVWVEGVEEIVPLTVGVTV